MHVLYCIYVHVNVRHNHSCGHIKTIILDSQQFNIYAFTVNNLKQIEPKHRTEITDVASPCLLKAFRFYTAVTCFDIFINSRKNNCVIKKQKQQPKDKRCIYYSTGVCYKSFIYSSALFGLGMWYNSPKMRTYETEWMNAEMGRV